MLFLTVRRETHGKAIEKWGFERVLTITVDNDSSNNGSVQYVKKTINQWGSAILGGQHMHLRCSAHILNLIMQDGLNVLGNVLLRLEM